MDQTDEQSGNTVVAVESFTVAACCDPDAPIPYRLTALGMAVTEAAR
jgi:hypothetical protein